MRAFAIAVLLGLGLVLVAGTPASAATITEPSGETVRVGIGDQGYASPFTVKAGGFEPYESVFVEMCNGRPPTADSWTPSIDCDLGSAPAAAVADENGVATFSADDPNHALFPFVGPGPQALFNCLAPGMAASNNGAEDFTNCQLRVSTSNTDVTDDQVFVAMALPKGAKVGWGKPTFPKPAGAAGQQVANAAGSDQSASKAAADRASATKSADRTSDVSTGSSSSSDFPVLPVVLSVVVIAGAAALLILHKRRSGRVAA